MNRPPNGHGTMPPPEEPDSDVTSCRLGRCLKCGGQWPRHIVPGCKGPFPRIMEHRQRVRGERKGQP